MDANHCDELLLPLPLLLLLLLLDGFIMCCPDADTIENAECIFSYHSRRGWVKWLAAASMPTLDEWKMLLYCMVRVCSMRVHDAMMAMMMLSLSISLHDIYVCFLEQCYA